MLPLTERERWLALTGVVLLGIGGLYAFVVKPVRARSARLLELLPQKQQDLTRLRAAGRAYHRLQGEVLDLRARLPEDANQLAPLPHLETLLSQHGLKDRVDTMNQDPPFQEGRYTVAAVQIHLTGIALPPLLRFLAALDKAEVPLRVDSLQISRPPQDPNGLDAALSVLCAARASQTPLP